MRSGLQGPDNRYLTNTNICSKVTIPQKEIERKLEKYFYKTLRFDLLTNKKPRNKITCQRAAFEKAIQCNNAHKEIQLFTAGRGLVYEAYF